MQRILKKHVGYYISLLAILLLGLLLVVLTSPDIKTQSTIILVTAFFYVCWGIVHHQINHELTPRVMIEYVLIGALGICIIFFMLTGGIL